MPSKGFRETVVFVSGSTPQIITEAIYALAHRVPAVVPDDLHIITTAFGRRRINESLIDAGVLGDLCREYGLPMLGPDHLSFTVITDSTGNEIDDIRDERDNGLTGNTIAALVRRLAEDPARRLHCCLAGGRKTMSFYLGAALQLFGRPWDKLYHVLVTPAFESLPEFFYKPKRNRAIEWRGPGGTTKRLNTDDAEITLAELPFIRLTDKLDLRGKSDKASRADNGPPQIFEVIEAGGVFEGAIGNEEAASGFERPVTKETLFDAVVQHYSKVLKQDGRDRSEAGLRPFPMDEMHNTSGAALLIRIGRHSGAEAVTIEGHREIKIMGSSEPLDHATTFWLASESNRPSATDPLPPFGWAVLEAEPLDVSTGIYSRKPAAQTRPVREQEQATLAEPVPVEPTLKPEPPVQTTHHDVTLVWSPGNRTLTAVIEGKKAFANNVERAFVHESLWPKLEKKKSVKATIVVEPLGNAFRIVKVEAPERI
jgi:CRISPR-associated protein (TIGR02584 family)